MKAIGVKMSTHGSNMTRVFLIALLFSSLLFSASVKLHVVNSKVVYGNRLIVEIIAEGQDIKFPNITDIGGFPIEDYKVSKNSKILTFSFFPETNLSIPAFKVRISGKVYKTEPLKISVVPASEVEPERHIGYTMELKSTKNRVFVGEPFVMTIDYFEPISSSVSKIEYTPPDFKGFYSKAFGKERLKKATTGTIHELKYILNAKKDGNLTLPPPKVRVSIRNAGGSGSDPFGFMSNSVRWHSIHAKPLSISVEPLPNKVDLVGLFEIKSSVDKKIVKANTPVTYTLKITGEGSLDDIINPKFDMEGVTVYGDDAKINTKVIGAKIISTYERKYVFISDIDFTIPSLSFRVFNYKTKKRVRLHTKEMSIIVDGTGTTVVAHGNIQTSATDRAKKAEANRLKKEKLAKEIEEKNILEDVDYYKKLYEKYRMGYSVWSLIMAFFSGVILTLLSVKIYRYINDRKHGTRQKEYTLKESLAILYPHINTSPKIEEMVRKLYKLEGGDTSIEIDKKELAHLVAEVMG